MRNMITTIMVVIGLVVLVSPGRAAQSNLESANDEAENSSPFETVLSAPRVKFSVSLFPADAKPGDTVTLAIKTNIETGWHVYGITDDDKSVGGLPTSIRVRSRSLTPVDDGFTPSSPPMEVKVGDENQQHHVGEFSWIRKFKVNKGSEHYFASGSITFQVCDEDKCLPPGRVTFSLGIKHGTKVQGTVTRKSVATGMGDPIVVPLTACDTSRPRVKVSLASIFLGGAQNDKLAYKGNVDVDGETVDIYLPKSNSYKLTNSSSEETIFANDSTYVSLDYDGDGVLGKYEYSACNRPIRILDSMFQVTEIDVTGKKMTLQQVDVPLAGTILNRRCPEFKFTTIDGKTVSDQSILGKVTILDIWAVT